MIACIVYVSAVVIWAIALIKVKKSYSAFNYLQKITVDNIEEYKKDTDTKINLLINDLSTFQKELYQKTKALQDYDNYSTLLIEVLFKLNGIEFPRNQICRKCKGEGYIPVDSEWDIGKFKICPECNGNKIVLDRKVNL